MTLEHAYRHCELITRREAANFYYGIRLLTPERRRAMCAVYAFARRVDDIGDGGLPSAQKLSLLQEQDRALAALPGPLAPLEPSALPGPPTPPEPPAPPGQFADEATAGDAVMVALGDACERFAIPPDALRALIAGVGMDVEGVRYETFEDLVVYCRRVAGAIGRACLAIFGLCDRTHTDMAGADRLADDLGVALQITNILRDIREDADRGRVYLPAEDLRRYKVIAISAHSESLEKSRIGYRLDRIDEEELGQVEALIRFEAARAREWFDRGIALAPLLDRRSRACLLAMAGIYSRLLDRIAADPAGVLRERVALPMHEKAWVAARSMLGGGL